MNRYNLHMAARSILALDLSLVSTGWVVYNPPTGITFQVVDTSKLPMKTPGDEVKRMHFIVDAVAARLKPLKSPLVVIEGFSFASRGRSVFQIGGLGYLVRDLLMVRGEEWVDVSPSEVKKFVTGKGNAEKSLMLKEVFKRWQADFDDDNIADAYALMMIGRALTGSWKPTVDTQRQVLKTIAKKYPQFNKE